MLFKRSLASELLNTLGGVFTVLYTIVLAVGMVQVLRLASGGAIANSQVLQMMLYNSLTYIAPLLSLSLFVSVLITMLRWWQDNEMVVWFSSGGQSLLAWVFPTLRITLPMVLIIGVLSIVVSPWARSQAEVIRNQFEQQEDVDQLTTGRFIELNGGRRVLFVDDIDQSSNQVHDIFVADQTTDKDATLVAKTGTLQVNSEGDRYIILTHGRRFDISKNSAQTRVVDFDEYGLRLDVKIDNPWQTNKMAAQPMSVLFLDHSNKAMAEVFWRLCWPLAAINLALLALPLSFASPRAGRSLNLVISALVYILYLNGISIMQTWIEHGKINYLFALVALNGAVLIFTMILYYRWVFCMRWLPQWASLWYWQQRSKKVE